MAEFLNNWIYTLDTTGDLTLLTPKRLPKSWTDPVTGNKYGSLSSVSDSELNSLGWYKVLEERPPITKYEYATLSTRTFTNPEFTSTYVNNYLDIEDVRAIKIEELEAEKDLTIVDALDNKSIDENLYTLYRIVAKLIGAFAESNPVDYVNNEPFLQNTLTKVNALTVDVDAVQARIDQAETETDIPTLIAL